MAAHRARQRYAAFADEFVSPEIAAGSKSAAGTSSPKDNEVAHAILEAKTLAGTLYRLGREARPQFAWRCAEVAAALTAVLESVFGDC